MNYITVTLIISLTSIVECSQRSQASDMGSVNTIQKTNIIDADRIFKSVMIIDNRTLDMVNSEVDFGIALGRSF